MKAKGPCNDNKNIERQRFYSTKAPSKKKKATRLQKPSVEEKESFLKISHWNVDTTKINAVSVPVNDEEQNKPASDNVEETKAASIPVNDIEQTEQTLNNVEDTEAVSIYVNDMEQIKPLTVDNPEETRAAYIQTASSCFLQTICDQRPTYALGATSRTGRQVRLPGKFL